MLVKTTPIGPLVCEKCGRISHHHLEFKTRWYVPVLLDQFLLKAKLKCDSCGSLYKVNDTAKEQAKLYNENFGKDRNGLAIFENYLLSIIDSFNVLQNNSVSEENLEKAIDFVLNNYSISKQFDYNFYKRYFLILCMNRNYTRNLEDKFFK